MSIRPAAAEDGARLRAITRAAYAHWVPIIGARPAPMDEDHAAQCAAGEAWFHGDAAAIVHQRGAKARATQIHRQDVAHAGTCIRQIWPHPGCMARSGRRVWISSMGGDFCVIG